MFLSVAPKKAPQKVSSTPSRSPPATAPPRLVKPPITAATSALTISWPISGLMPMSGARVDRDRAHRLAELGPAEERHQDADQRGEARDDDEIRGIHPQRTDCQRRAGIRSIERVGIVLPVQTNRRLDDQT